MLVHLVSKLRHPGVTFGDRQQRSPPHTWDTLSRQMLFHGKHRQNFKWTDRWGHRVYIAPINRSEAVLSLKT